MCRTHPDLHSDIVNVLCGKVDKGEPLILDKEVATANLMKCPLFHCERLCIRQKHCVPSLMKYEAIQVGIQVKIEIIVGNANTSGNDDGFVLVFITYCNNFDI